MGIDVYTRPSKRFGSGPLVIAVGETRVRHVSFLMLSGSSPRHEYASHWPSRENTGIACTPLIWNASPPGAAVRKNQISSSEPSRLLENASRPPSGDQRGLDASVEGLVYRNADAGPSAGAIQISLWRRSLSSTTVVRTKATRRPSGESAGLLTTFSR